MQIYLKFNNGKEQIRFPVNPPETPVTKTRDFADSSVLGLGEVTTLGSNKLREISFSSFFPRDYNPTYCEYTALLKPNQYVHEIERFMSHPTLPVRLIITGAAVNINMPVTIRSFLCNEKAGHPGDVWFDISMKEFVYPKITKIKVKPPALPPRIQPPSAAKATKPKPKAKPKTTTAKKDTSHVTKLGSRPDTSINPGYISVPANESIMMTAKRIWGDSKDWLLLAKYNKLQPPYTFPALHTLKIPDAAALRKLRNAETLENTQIVKVNNPFTSKTTNFGGYFN